MHELQARTLMRAHARSSGGCNYKTPLQPYVALTRLGSAHLHGREATLTPRFARLDEAGLGKPCLAQP